MRLNNAPQALRFIAASGAGWLLDTTVLLLLTGPGNWNLVAANVVSSCCGVLLVFTLSARSIFKRNEGMMAQKVGALLLFNGVVILVSSFILGAIAVALAATAAHLGWAVAQAALRLASKVLVTPVTLALNFVVVRFLLERFVGLRAPAAASAPARLHPRLHQGAP